MKKVVMLTVAAAALGLAIPSAGYAGANPDPTGPGKRVGLNPLLLAETKCGNKGGGNGGEALIVDTGECLKNQDTGEDGDIDPADAPTD